MKTAKPKSTDEMRMSVEEFNRIMSQALRVKPEPKKASRPTKRKASARPKKPVK